MNGFALLDEAARRGIVLYLKDGRLRFRAPPGALTPALRGALRARQDELRSELSRRVRRGGGGLDGDLVETRFCWGAVLLATPYGEVWLARTGDVADGLIAEGANVPILLPEEVATLRGKSDEAIRAALEVRRIFPGGTMQ